ncbi:hypothetical protein DNTS_030977 [Danionella cerebrum]|uniref:Translocation protein SEC62 n=1 Tax=Danionella cerebrum TaxID=2873325 RepID=A0A553PWA4_9TELE|nr:hypothetical protein DNTS_030977 [Danionella translucida]
MAERRRHKKRIQEVSEPTKEEKAVAKYLRFNCPNKSTNMMGHRVDYFIASKAVDCLLDSKWAKAKKSEEAVFTTRELLKKQFFHRALKVMKKKPEKDVKKEKEKEKEKTKSDSSKEDEKKSKKDKEKKKESEAADTKKDKNDDSPGSPKKKKEVYFWVYDPVHFKTFAMGLILVIAVIAATLFPLWPAEMRVGVYYLSVAAGCFVASILLLAVARCILFLLIWLVTGGRHHFWFLPNLTADVGFIDSFRPLYTHEYKSPRGGNKKNPGSQNPETSKAPKSDSEDKSDSEKKEEEEEEEEEEKGSVERQSDTDSDRREDDGSQHSNGNDFEMITREELEQHTEEEEEAEEEEQSQAQQPMSAQT